MLLQIVTPATIDESITGQASLVLEMFEPGGPVFDLGETIAASQDLLWETTMTISPTEMNTHNYMRDACVG